MSRWHSGSCKAPDVVVDGTFPRCRACNTSFAEIWQGVRHTEMRPLPPIPQDEIQGNLNLYWPPLVPYKSRHSVHTETGPLKASGNSSSVIASSDSLLVHADQTQKLPDDIEAVSTGGSTSTLASRASIYEPGLTRNEFRLLCLSETDRPNVIHAYLETYDHHQCPEYETVSYTWGGEKGDSSLTEPIFIGPHWDFLLQTKNCTDILRFLRPPRGFRLVWVDAICINQKDSHERGHQVAKMARIYEEARRVVVFLGEEFVNLELSRHPQRLKLQDWTRSPDKNNQEREHREHWKVDLHKLLRQKYFSRVWVIQELVLSRQIAIQLGDIEFWADSLTPQALQSAHPDWKWENTPAPWVENIAQRELLKRDIYDILRATSGSKSSDPRDRIFGVNALLGASQDKLPPNYSLSCLHVFLGTFAYLILNMRHTELLYSAAGMSAWNSYPSWMPDWKSSGQDWVFQEVSLEAEAPHDELFYHWWSKHRRPENNSQHVFCVSSENRRWKTSDELYKDRKIQNTGWDSCTEIHVLQFSEPITHDELALRKTRPWYRGARVDAATGSLSINLIHLLKFRAVPENIKISKKYSSACKIFEVKVGGKQTALAVMYIITEGFDLGLILPGSDHLFILDEGRGYCLFLIMREAETSGTFRLLTCCYQVWFQTKPANWVRRSNYTTFDRYAYESTSHTKERECERRDEKLFLADLQGDFVGILQCIYFEAMFRQEEQDLIDTIFPGVENQRDVISAFQGLLNEQRGAAPGFLQSYARCFRFDYHPKIQGEHVELMILPDKWMAMHEPRFTSAYTEVFKEWRFWNGSWSKSSLVSVSMFRKQKPIYIRASKSNIERVAVKTQAYQDLSSLTRAYNLTSEMEMDFYKQKDSPRETDGLVGYPRWPETIAKGFEIDGSTCKVEIL